MEPITVKIKRLDKTVPLPAFAYEFDAGLDIRSSESFTLQPQERKLAKTALVFEIPPHFVGLVWDKGSTANKGLHTMAGVLDCNYRGELFIALINLSAQPITIAKGDKIAQLLIQPVNHANIREVDSVSETARNDKALGSSGHR